MIFYKYKAQSSTISTRIKICLRANQAVKRKSNQIKLNIVENQMIKANQVKNCARFSPYLFWSFIPLSFNHKRRIQSQPSLCAHVKQYMKIYPVNQIYLIVIRYNPLMLLVISVSKLCYKVFLLHSAKWIGKHFEYNKVRRNHERKKWKKGESNLENKWKGRIKRKRNKTCHFN